MTSLFNLISLKQASKLRIQATKPKPLSIKKVIQHERQRRALATSHQNARPRRQRTPSPSILRLGKEMLITMKQRGKLVRLDPLKILAPAKKKLTTLEAQRLIDVINDVRLRSELLVYLPGLIKELPKQAANLGPEVVESLKSFERVREQFVKAELEYWEAQSKPRDPDGRSKSGKSKITRQGFLNDDLPGKETSPVSVENAVTKLNNRRTALEFEAKNILRLFRQNDSAFQYVVRDSGVHKARESSYYIQYLLELRDVLLAKLLISPLEQQEKMQFIAQVAAQERANSLIIEKLEKDLQLAVQDRDSEIKSKNDYIRKLQNDLQVLEKATEDDVRRTKTESEKQIFTDNKLHEARNQKYQYELKTIGHEHDSTIGHNREEELVLRRKKWKVETEIENWLQKYDFDMTEKQEEYEKIDAVYKEEKKQLMELEERFSRLETEYKDIIETRRLEKVKREGEERHMKIKFEAATCIQAVWRAYKIKKAIKLKEKQKGRNKKKKKQKDAMAKLGPRVAVK